MRSRFSWWWGLTLVLLGLGWPDASGQAPPPAPTSMPTMDYADAAFGYELNLPAGWDYDRSRFQQYEDSIGLLRGRGPGGREALQILVFRVQPIVLPKDDEGRTRVRLPSFEDWVIGFGKSLAENVNAERVEWEPWSLPPRAGALLTYSSKIGAMAARTHTLCVPFDSSTVWVLVYSGSAASPEDEQRLRREFDQLSRTLRIHYDPGADEQLAAAFERGELLLERLRKQAAGVRLDDEEFYYDIAIAGQSIGYLRRRISREEYVFTKAGATHRYAEDGLRVRERSWRFASDGTVRRTRLDMFSSFSGQNELIENQQTQIPAPDVQPQRVLVKTDSVVRTGDVLFSSFTTNLDRALPDPGNPLSVGPVYLDLAWERICPDLLREAPQWTHAFAIYNTETRALVSEMITPLGERTLPGHKAKLRAFEVRVGLIDQPSLLYTDERGNLVRLVAGDLVIDRTEREQVERTYGGRRDEACRRFGLRDD